MWRIEQFQVVPWPARQYGEFYDGDSYVVLDSRPVEEAKSSAGPGLAKLRHDIYFWLGSHTTQDEAGTAAYKTVELDEFLHGAATQHRELQSAPSDDFVALFPRMSIHADGVRSGFRHVAPEAKEPVRTLLRVFQTGVGGVVAHEVKPTWRSLDDGDVFVYDTGDKIWVWQGQRCSPMEKAKAAQVVHDMTLAKHVDVEVLSQAESRSHRVVELLGGDDDTPRDGFSQPRPLVANRARAAAARPSRLFRLSDASGQLTFDLVKDGGPMSAGDLDPEVFLLDDAGRAVWVWEGSRASRAERARWLSVAGAYIRHVQHEGGGEAHLMPLAKVAEGSEGRAFMKAMETH